MLPPLAFFGRSGIDDMLGQLVLRLEPGLITTDARDLRPSENLDAKTDPETKAGTESRKPHQVCKWVLGR